jgi:starch synthase
VAILGDNAEEFESRFDELGKKHRGRFAARSGFDTRLTKRIYAGSDFFLMPSKFEPCGLSQMIACRYGAVPIVSRTGGLMDTIRDIQEHEDGNGITFSAPVTMNDEEWRPAATANLDRAIGRAFELYKDRPRFDDVRRRAMRCDFTWDRSAGQYEDAYAEAIRREGGLPEHYGP